MGRTAANLVLMLALAPALIVTACAGDGRTLREASPDQTASIATEPEVTGPTTPPPFRVFASWEDSANIDPEFTCSGDNVSPSVSFEGVPPEAKELAIVATGSDQRIRWFVAGILPTTTAIADRVTPRGAIVVRNDFGNLGYSGPCPAIGTREMFTITAYALNAKSLLTGDEDATTALNIISGMTLKTTTVVGYFTR